MLKRVMGFLSIFLLILVFLYAEPILIPPETSSVKKEATEQPVSFPATSLTYETLPTEGPAEYIGQETSKFEAHFGKPVSIYESGFQTEKRIYELASKTGYLDATIIDDKVAGITLMGDDALSLKPFELGMSLSEAAKITTIFPNFSIDYDDETTTLELTEEDMNYRPLVAFANGSFAVLFFNQETNKLFGAAYLDTQLLLELAPYQVTSGNSLAYQLEEQTEQEWAALDERRASQAASLINLIRSQLDETVLNVSAKLQSTGGDLLNKLKQRPQDYFSDSRLTSWQEALAATQSSRYLILTDKEFKSLAKESTIELEQQLVQQSVVDPAFSVLYWYSDPYFAPKIGSDEERGELGVAFVKDTAIVLVQKSETVEESDTK